MSSARSLKGLIFVTWTLRESLRHVSAAPVGACRLSVHVATLSMRGRLQSSNSAREAFCIACSEVQVSKLCIEVCRNHARTAALPRSCVQLLGPVRAAE